MASRYVMTEREGRKFTGLGSLVVRLIHPQTVGSDQLGVSLVDMQPGDKIVRHRHPYEEAYYILEGEGTMFLEGEPEIALVPGMSVYVPPNTVHGQVADKKKSLRILCSLSPPPVEGEIPEILE
jgi:quercetin dioxygenase-like cupin family protein